MDLQIEHSHVQVNGLNLHVAQIGKEGSKTVVFCHGFPEIWYSWRHQMIAAAKNGYRAIAFDYRGYGLSDPPPVPAEATYLDLISDLQSLLDVLAIPQAFLVAKDFGARIVYLFTLLHPTRVLGVVTLGIPFLPPNIPPFLEGIPEGFYILRWQTPGKAEADFARFDRKTVVRKIYILFSRAELQIAEKNQEWLDLVDESEGLPSWISEDDIAVYGDLYEKSGYETALQVPYRSMLEKFNITAEKVDAPALLIIGEKDYFLKFTGMNDYIKNEQSKYFVPKLETKYISEGSHFVQEQFPDQVNQLLLDFLNRHI